jgi:hypothetical protein
MSAIAGLVFTVLSSIASGHGVPGLPPVTL